MINAPWQIQFEQAPEDVVAKARCLLRGSTTQPPIKPRGYKHFWVRPCYPEPREHPQDQSKNVEVA